MASRLSDDCNLGPHISPPAPRPSSATRAPPTRVSIGIGSLMATFGDEFENHPPTNDALPRSPMYSTPNSVVVRIPHQPSLRQDVTTHESLVLSITTGMVGRQTPQRAL
jgi:hypothetical protein